MEAYATCSPLCQYCCIDASHGRCLSLWRESLTAIAQECCELYLRSPVGSIPQSNSCTDTYNPSRKPRRARHTRHCRRNKGGLISDVFLWTFLHGLGRVGWLARTYLQQDVAWKTCRERWKIKTSGRKVSGEYVRVARHDYIYIYIYIYFCVYLIKISRVKMAVFKNKLFFYIQRRITKK